MAYVGKLPLKGYETVPWTEVADFLAKHPREAVLFEDFADTPRIRSLLTMVNSRKVRALNDLPGKVRANMRNSYMDSFGRRRGSLYLTYTPGD